MNAPVEGVVAPTVPLSAAPVIVGPVPRTTAPDPVDDVTPVPPYAGAMGVPVAYGTRSATTAVINTTAEPLRVMAEPEELLSVGVRVRVVPDEV